MSPTSTLGVAVIFSAPTTSAIRPRPDSMKSIAPCIAADPVAQAFSYRVAGVWAKRSSPIATSAPWKSCRAKPLLKTPTKIPSTSSGAMPA